MDLKGIMLNENNQSQMVTYCLVHLCNILRMTNGRDGEQIWGCDGSQAEGCRQDDRGAAQQRSWW